MGESRRDRADMIATLASLPSHPESVPINMLVQVEGTPLNGMDALDPFEFVRTVAVARIAMRARWSASPPGASKCRTRCRPWRSSPVANSVFVGPELLTTPNPARDRDTATLRPASASRRCQPSPRARRPTRLKKFPCRRRPTGSPRRYGHVWLPYTQMARVPPPLPVAETRGTRIVLADGRELIDGIASWWTACHGYNHPHIRAAVRRAAGAHAPRDVRRLGQRARAQTSPPPGRDAPRPAEPRVLPRESGSVAVEIALKMALQYWLNQGVRGRHRFVSFQGAYHGDTFAAMSVCDPEEGMHSLFAGALPEQHVVPLPEDEAGIAAFDAYLARNGEDVAAVIVEPLVQGAGGMRFHAPETLRALRTACDRHGLLLIADEIMTGFGRTGTLFRLRAGGCRARRRHPFQGAHRWHHGARRDRGERERVFEAFLSDDPDAALMHGPTFMAQSPGLRRRQRLPRPVRAASRGSPRHAPSKPTSPLRWSPRGGCPGVLDVRTRGAIGVIQIVDMSRIDWLKARFVEAGVWVPPLRRYRLRNARAHHRRGRPRPAHGTR